MKFKNQGVKKITAAHQLHNVQVLSICCKVLIILICQVVGIWRPADSARAGSLAQHGTQF